MKYFKVVLLLIIMLCSFNTCLAISATREEVVLDTNDITTPEVKLFNEENYDEGNDNPVTVGTDSTTKTLKEKLNDVYHLEVEQIDSPTYLFKDILTKKFSEESKLESLRLWGAYNGSWGLKFIDDGSLMNDYDYNAVNWGIDGKLKDNNMDFRMMLGVSPKSSMNFSQALFKDMYIATNKIPHHRIQIGHYRPQVGIEGGSSAYTLPFVARAQIARKFGTVRKLGAKIQGNYNLVDYDLGIYSSDTYFSSFFPGTEFIGWVNLKPLALTDGKYGYLKVGGGLDAGKRDNDFCVTGAYISYEYKKFMANFEWANANGYNGNQTKSTDVGANGFYTTLSYRITPKVQVLARYDQFNPDTKVNKLSREYSVGLNYFIKGQALRLMLNYVFCQNETANNSHRLILGTQILI